ncbi:MAG: flagellar hook-length control protein FliK, partial [Lachnospiraceae bacterium]|nr:flagellar hook-length control protein FliK [Lachnospiraceae bacterium]
PGELEGKEKPAVGQQESLPEKAPVSSNGKEPLPDLPEPMKAEQAVGKESPGLPASGNNSAGPAALPETSQQVFKETNVSAEELMAVLKRDPKAFGEGLKKLFKDRFSIEPEALDKKSVGRLYERLRTDTEKLAKLLEGTETSNGTMGKTGEALKSLQGNLDFMQQLNQAYGYVQLPLKLNGEEKNGDLYVFGRKGRKPQPGEQVTALLHLDMDNLGPLDIYVNMKDKKVSMRFTVSDEETLDFLGEHMDQLTGRIEKRGYEAKSSLDVKGEEEAPYMEKILGGSAPHVHASRQAFEARI